MGKRKKGLGIERDLSSAPMRISKLDAAQSQLRTAIWLYFHDMDPISIHTLASAVRIVVRKLHQHRGTGHLMLHDELVDLYVKPEYKDALIALITEAANFFKHATDDPDDILAFNPKASESVLLDSVWAVQQLTKDDCVEYAALRTWLIAQNPEMLKVRPPELTSAVVDSILNLGRQMFYEEFQRQWRKPLTVPLTP